MVFRLRLETEISKIDQAAWNRLVPLPSSGSDDPDNPFIRHEFLAALEASGSVGHKTGWTPAHVLMEDDSGALIAAAPAYLKSHSMGEYVFDHAWAEAYERAGGRYYPKLQLAVPFTPATGPRLLVGDHEHAQEHREALAQTLPNLAQKLGASSIHATFLTDSDKHAFLKADYLERNDKQFHWINDNYQSFDDFLAALSSRKRKLIKRERRDALKNDITIEHVTGHAITSQHMDSFFEFYLDTGGRKWGRHYLNRAFFERLRETMAERIVLILARRDGRYIAGAINFIGGRTLYGRNWGCIEDHPFLHFEVCYYQAIDFAIAHGLTRVEAGAQGEHKLARGYRPVTTSSAHYILDPHFSDAVAAYLQQERAAVAELTDELSDMTPFRRGQSSVEEQE